MKNLTPMLDSTEFEQIIAIDIETSSKGELLDIGVYDGANYATFANWREFFTGLLRMQYRQFRVIAHNGFGFDFIGFTQWLLKHHQKFDIEHNQIQFLSSEALIMGIVITTEQAKYTFVDTMRYFPMTSLQNLAKDYLGDSKEDVPKEYISRMEDYKREYPKEYYAYLKQDCKLLYDIYIKFREQINEFAPIGELGLSSGSTALKSFRRWLAAEDDKLMIFAAPKDSLNAADYAMRGGLTLYIGNGEHEQHLYERVNHYDVISMYPSVMRSVPVPTSPMRRVKRVVRDYGRIRPGWYLCDFEQSKGQVPFLYSLESKNPVWNGTGLLSHFELEFLSEYGMYKEYDGIIYEDYAYPFDAYFSEVLNRRMTAKAAGETAKAHALKILANSLYGKFAQSASREIIAISADLDWYDSEVRAKARAGNSGIIEYFYDDDLVLYGVKSRSTSFSNRFIGAMVTSIARLKLGAIFNTVRAIYCDTDSLFTQDRLAPYFIGNQPGDFEESKESPNSLLCLGKKSYCFADTIHFKGVPKGSLSREDLEAIRQGEEVGAKYRTPTAFKTAIKKDVARPNEFIEKTRKVRRAKSMAEMGDLRLDNELLSSQDVYFFLEHLTKLI